MSELDIDLPVDLNTIDETGRPWAFLDSAPDPTRVVAGRHLVVGSGSARAFALVIDVTEGVVHVPALPGSIAKNRHLLGRSVA